MHNCNCLPVPDEGNSLCSVIADVSNNQSTWGSTQTTNEVCTETESEQIQVCKLWLPTIYTSIPR